jgi:hypothetical protein
MTLRDRLGLSEARHRLVVRALQALLVGVIAFGVARASWGVVVNAILALAVTFVPALLRREYNYSMDLGLVLWLTAAVVLHTLGTLGLYDWVWWFDHLAHTVSASVVAGMGYSLFRAFELYSDEIEVPEEFHALFIVIFVLAAGVFWEVIEFGFGDLITVYGVGDIVGDMVFNTLGAVIVAVLGTGALDGLVGFFGRRLRAG